MTTKAMTPEKARERLEWYVTFSDAVDQVIEAREVLATLLNPTDMLKIWEEQGKVERFGREAYGGRDTWFVVPQQEEP